MLFLLEKFIAYFEYLNYWHSVMVNDLITEFLQLVTTIVKYKKITNFLFNFNVN